MNEKYDIITNGGGVMKRSTFTVAPMPAMEFSISKSKLDAAHHKTAARACHEDGKVKEKADKHKGAMLGERIIKGNRQEEHHERGEVV